MRVGCVAGVRPMLPYRNDVASPLGVVALSCLFVVGAVACSLSVASIVTPGGYLEPIWLIKPRAHDVFLQMGGWSFLVLSTVCLACIAAAYGLLTRKRWGYRLGVALVVVNLAGDIIETILGIEPRAIIGVPIAALILWHLSTHRVRNYFQSSKAGHFSGISQELS